MNTLTKFLLCSLFLFKCSAVFSQFDETIFYDTISKVSKTGYVNSGFGEGKFMYLSGSSFGIETSFPTVTKMDTSGNVIWTAVDNDNYERFGGTYMAYDGNRSMCRSSIKSGNRLFCIVQGYYDLFLPEELWCISDSSGQLLWKLAFNTPHTTIATIADYNNSELLVITRTDYYLYDYHVIDKQTGKELFAKRFGHNGVSLENAPNIFVDKDHNILLSWDDTCKKFRDDRLNDLAWVSNMPNNGTLKMIDIVTQDSGRYIFMGRNNIRAVDSLTGNTIWFKPIQVGFVLGVQSGGDGNPKDFILKDSLLFVTWVSPYVGGVDLTRGFVLTCINTSSGTIRYNVAQTFVGVPAVDPFNDKLDWPFKICMSANMQIYMTGSYDNGAGPENSGNWGIMKFDWRTGAKLMEATITEDPTVRMELSKGKFLHYFNGRMYCAGNVQQPGGGSANYYNTGRMVSFDTTSVYIERSRIAPDNTFRYPSSLAGITNFGTGKMLLLKKVGRSAVIELRNSGNQLLWSRSYSRQGKFFVPQNIKNLSDTVICASLLLYSENEQSAILPGIVDSVIFLKFDPSGNTIFNRSVLINAADSFRATNVYFDQQGKANFMYLRKPAGQNAIVNYGRSLNVVSPALGSIGGTEFNYFSEVPKIRLNTVQHYNGDTMMHFVASSNIAYLQSTRQTSAGTYDYLGVKLIQGFSRVFSSVKSGDATALLAGISTAGNIMAAKYNYRLISAPLVWSQELPYSGSMLNADTSKTSMYAISETAGNSMLLTKLDKNTGSIAWNIEKNFPQKKIIPIDFTFNQQTNKFYVAGYVADSTFTGTKSNYFLFAVDSSGNVVRELVRQGFGLNETGVTGISVLDNGTVIYGGHLSTGDAGTVGFYKSDCYAAVNYSFIGSGNWDVPANWTNNAIPPAVLPDCSEIFINPAGTSACILNVPQTISSGARLTVMAGKTFIITGNLVIQ